MIVNGYEVKTREHTWKPRWSNERWYAYHRFLNGSGIGAYGGTEYAAIYHLMKTLKEKNNEQNVRAN